MARYRKSTSVLVDQHSTSKKPKEVVLLVVGLSLLIGLLLALSILPFARLTEFSKHFVVASSSSSSPSMTTTKLVSRSPAAVPAVAAAAAVQQANVKLQPKYRYGGGFRHHFEASAHEVPSGQNPDSNR